MRVPSAYRREHALRAAGTAYRLVKDMSLMIDEELARAFNEERSTFTKKRNGRIPSDKSRSRERLLRIGERGVNLWPLVVDDLAAVVQVDVITRSTDELRVAQALTDLLEQESNGAFDNIQFRRMQNLAICPNDARTKKLRQIVLTLIALAIHDELAVRRSSQFSSNAGTV